MLGLLAGSTSSYFTPLSSSMAGHPYGGPLGNPYDCPGFRGNNKAASKGGLKSVQRSTAIQLKEHEPLFTTYEHLAGQERGDAALLMLRKASSVVKPIMQKHGWRVKVLAEFLPLEQNLLGLNINKGYKICIRLRYHHSHDLFLPFEDVVDTLLHELCHNIWGPHDSNFHKLWEELRDEYEVLVRKGYTGEGFLSEGKKLGGSSGRVPPPHEMREVARNNAEKRRSQGALFSGSGQKLGGTPVHLQGPDIRKVMADQATRRKAISTGCASGSHNAIELSQQAESGAFRTKAEEDDANNLAISKALQELMEQEEDQKLSGSFERRSNGGGLEWSAENGLYDPEANLWTTNGRHDHPSEEEQMKWAMKDSVRCAGESSSKIDEAKQTLQGRHIPSQGSDSTASPEDSEHTSTNEDLARTTLPDSPERTASSTGHVHSSSPKGVDRAVIPADDLPTPNHRNKMVTKRRRLSSRSSSAPSPVHPPKQKRIIEEANIETDPGSRCSFTESAASNDWACEVCTCINPLQFLACDACGVERPQAVLLQSQPPVRKPIPRHAVSGAGRELKSRPLVRNESLGWNCRCGAFMEHKWWTCSACGTLKATS